MAVDTLVDLAIDVMAQYILGKSAPSISLSLHLFTNNVPITSETVLANLTECAAPGYASIPLVGTNWSGSTATGVANYTYPQVTFNFTGPGTPAETIYGHYVSNGAGGALLWAQLWAQPFVIPSGGGSVAVNPSWSDKQC